MPKILLVDIDGTVFDAEGKLSGRLITVVAQEKYDGVYYVTHRCRSSQRQLALQSVHPKSPSDAKAGENPGDPYVAYSDYREYPENAGYVIKKSEAEAYLDRLTSVVVKKFCEVTQLPLFGISTPDDRLEKQSCNHGYLTILEPFDSAILENYNASKSIKIFRPGNPDKEFESFNPHTKNDQLEDVFVDLQKHFPNANRFTIDFYDDIKAICVNAALIEKAKLPANSLFRIMHWSCYSGVLNTINIQSAPTSADDQKSFVADKHEKSDKSAAVIEPGAPPSSVDTHRPHFSPLTAALPPLENIYKRRSGTTSSLVNSYPMTTFSHHAPKSGKPASETTPLLTESEPTGCCVCTIL